MTIKIITLSIIVIITISSCNSDKEKLFITTTQAINEPDRGSVRQDSVSVYDDMYLEIELSSYKNDSTRWFEAKRDLESGYVNGTNTITVKFFKITDEKGKPIIFENSTRFLNWMNAHGYDFVSESPKKFGTDYKFKKR